MVKFKSEKDLIKGLKEGDYDSFEFLFVNYYSRFVNFAADILKDSEAAEDIVQEQFMKVWLHRDRLKEDQSIESYLFILTKNAILNHIRDNKRLKPTELPESIVSSDLNSDLDASELQSRVQSLVSKMPPKRREVYILSRNFGLTNEEISKRLGLSIRTVERHISLALNELRNNNVS